VAGSAVAGCGSIAYAKNIEPERLVVESSTAPLKNLHPALEGLKIVQLSDIHLHPYTQIEHVKEAVTIANGLQPNLAVLTGDHVSQSAGSIAELAPALAGLNA